MKNLVGIPNTITTAALLAGTKRLPELRSGRGNVASWYLVGCTIRLVILPLVVAHNLYSNYSDGVSGNVSHIDRTDTATAVIR
jgi:hypothetical protein